MHLSLVETPEVSSLPDDPGKPGPSLLQRAEGLGRAAVMKEVLGPHLDAMLRPIYTTGIGPDEKTLPSLADEFPLRVLDRFFETLRSILEKRFHASDQAGQAYQEFLELNDRRPDLLFYHGAPMQNIQEAFGTSIGVPLTVATWITDQERPKDSASPYRDVAGLTEVMERESFSRILLRLTKGPNEFLGSGSDKFKEQNRVRFYGLELPIRDAFEMEDGIVVGLSGAYAVAADQRRKKLKSRPPYRESYQGNDSSGCPVRHGFESADGNPQQPLVLTGNEFVIAAMKQAEQLPLEVGSIDLHH